MRDIFKAAPAVLRIGLILRRVATLVERRDLYGVDLKIGGVKVRRSCPAVREPQPDPQSAGVGGNGFFCGVGQHIVEIKFHFRLFVFVTGMPVKPIFVKCAVCLIDANVRVAGFVFALIFADPSVAQRIPVTLICFFRTGSARHLNVNFVVGDLASVPIFLVFKRPDCRAGAKLRRNLCHDFITSRGVVFLRRNRCPRPLSVCTPGAIFVDAFERSLVDVSVSGQNQFSVLHRDILGEDTTVIVDFFPVLCDLPAPVLVCNKPLVRIQCSTGKVVVEHSIGRLCCFCGDGNFAGCQWGKGKGSACDCCRCQNGYQWFYLHRFISCLSCDL